MREINWSEFEPQGIVDWLLLPWWWLRYTRAWLRYRLLLWLTYATDDGVKYVVMSRHNDPRPIICPRCRWAGAVAELGHDYQPDGYGDVEGVSECPRCGLDL
jgi:hypothetical protein